MPVILPGLPEHVTALAYRAATADEHFFNPPEGISPGPSEGVVLVVEAAEGWEFRYVINSDETRVVAKEGSLSTPTELPVDTLLNQRYSFERASRLLLNGSASRIKRAMWSGKWLEQHDHHAPHFTLHNEAGVAELWQFKSPDLRANDWVVELKLAPVK